MKKILFLIFTVTMFFGCDDRLEELNTDKRNPSEVSPSSLFTRGMLVTFQNVESASVNDNPFRLYSQYWAQTTYPEESQYNLTSRSIPRNFWAGIYRDVLTDLKRSMELIDEQIAAGELTPAAEATLNNQKASINILMAYNYMLLVDTFGDVPFSEALDPENITPKYDDAATVYDNVISMLNDAIAGIDKGNGGFSAGQDFMYGGDMEAWNKFANSLKLRIGMRLADVDAGTANTLVADAISGGVFKTAADNASTNFGGAAPNTNPVYAGLVLSGRDDFVISDVFEGYLNDTQDPRLMTYSKGMVKFPFQMENETAQDTTLAYGVYAAYVDVDGNVVSETYLPAGTVVPGSDDGKLMVYRGGTYGTTSSFVTHSKLSAQLYNDPTFPGVLMGYGEVEFLMAEALERPNITGTGITGTAEDHYNAGIKASFDFWGADGYAAYIAQPEIAYGTAPGTYKDKIGKQLWVSLFNQGVESWATYRRLDFGVLQPLPGDTDVTVPNRLPYPLEEAQLNGPNRDAAASAIGGDDMTTKVFWDVN